MPQRLKQILWNIACSQLPEGYDLEVLRKIFLINFSMIIGGMFIAVFAIVAFTIGDYWLLFIDCIVLVLLVSAVLYLRTTHNYTLVSRMGLFLTGCYFFFLIVYGGVSQLTYMWAYTFPIVALFFLGSFYGSIAVLVLLALAATAFALDDTIPFITQYSPALKFRFIMVYTVLFLFALIKERLREIIQKRLKQVHAEKEALISDLKTALNEVRILRGILPICANCKKIRNDGGYWEQVEHYISSHSEARFSHSLCPDCVQDLYPQLQKKE